VGAVLDVTFLLHWLLLPSVLLLNHVFTDALLSSVTFQILHAHLLRWEEIALCVRRDGEQIFEMRLIALLDPPGGWPVC